MRERLSTQLREIVVAPAAAPAPPPNPEARRLARALRMESERATKGRDCGACRYAEAGGVLSAILEGREAEAVARQVARRFAGEPGWRADVVRDRYGATVALRAIVEEGQP
jgi:hypothetical protein